MPILKTLSRAKSIPEVLHEIFIRLKIETGIDLKKKIIKGKNDDQFF